MSIAARPTHQARRAPVPPPYPDLPAAILPGPAYGLQDTLRLLGLASRQLFFKTGLGDIIAHTEVSGIRLYDAAEVKDWATRLARLRLAQMAGESHVRYPLAQAPASGDRDAACPKCGGFARRNLNGEILCVHGHHTPPTA